MQDQNTKHLQDKSQARLRAIRTYPLSWLGFHHSSHKQSEAQESAAIEHHMVLNAMLCHNLT